MSVWQKIKKHPYRVAIVIVIIIAGGWWWYSSSHTAPGVTSYVTATAQTQPLIVSVNGTGQVSALNEVDLKPQGSSQSVVTVDKIDVVPAEMVKAGQLVALLDEKDASIAIEQAQATLESAQANYENVLAGTDPLNIDSAENAVSSAQLSLTNAQTSLVTTQATQATDVAQAYNKLLNSGLAANPNPGNPDKTTITLSGNYNPTTTGEYTVTLYTDQGGTVHFSYTGLESGNGLVSTVTPVSLGEGGLSVLFSSATPIINDTWVVTIPNTQSSDYTTNYNSYQTALQDQSTAMTDAQSAIQSAQISVSNAQIALEKDQEPPTDASVASAKSQVDNAQTNLQTAENNYAANEIVAPFAGQIATVPVQTGDQVSAGTTVATLITTQKIAQITLNEIDAAKVAVGQQVTLTFDALPSVTVAGTVSEVDTIGTVSSGVVNYGVQIALDTQDPRIKSGMSVTAAVITASETNALVVPSAAVKTQGTQSYVSVVDPKTIVSKDAATGGDILSATPTRVMVQTGLTNGTETEITSGLSPGQQVVTQTISTAKTATASSAASALRIPGLTTGGGAGGGFGGGGGGFGGGAGRTGGGGAGGRTGG